MEPIDRNTASTRLQHLRGMLAADYGIALDYALEFLERQPRMVEREHALPGAAERSS